MCPRTRESIWLKHTPRSIRSSETGFRRQQDSSAFFALIAREDRHYNEGNCAVRRAPTASTGSFVTSNATVFECRGLLLNRSRNPALERHRVPGPHDCDYLSPICRVIFCLAPNTSFRSETLASRAARTSRLPAKLLPRLPVWTNRKARNWARPDPFFGGIFAAPSADPFLVVGREGSAGGAVYPAVILAGQGRAEITRSNQKFAAPTLPSRLLSGLPRTLPSPQ
jgi:hypothetical protein